MNNTNTTYFDKMFINNLEKISIGNKSTINVGGSTAIAIGNLSGLTYQGNYSVAIGNQASQYSQGVNSVSIGNNAGQYSQGVNSIAIGNQAGQTNQPSNSIILNADSVGFSTATEPSALYINPIRNDNNQTNVLYYNTNTKEIVYGESMNAANLILQADNTNSNYFITFAKTATGAQALYTDPTTTPLTYNPFTSTLSATTFSGSLSGNATTATTATSATTATTATTANNVSLSNDTSNLNCYIPFSKTSTTNSLYTSSLRFNPFTSTLSATTFSGSLSGNATTATTATSATTATTANSSTYSQILNSFDLRNLSPNNIGQASVYSFFGSFNNNGDASWSDCIHFNTYLDGSGGNPNLLMLRKDAINMRIYQGAYNSTTPYSTYKDALLYDNTNCTVDFVKKNAVFKINFNGDGSATQPYDPNNKSIYFTELSPYGAYNAVHSMRMAFYNDYWEMACYRTNNENVENLKFRVASVWQNISFRQNGTIQAVDYAYNSDQRMKKDIEDLDDNESLILLRKIKPVKYNYRDPTRNTQHKVTGFIAQEVQSEFPDAVSTTKSFIPNILLNGTLNVISSENSKKIMITVQNLTEELNINSLLQIKFNDICYEVTIIEKIDQYKYFIVISRELESKLENIVQTDVFVYGIFVDDFLCLEKSYLFTINFAATQQLDRKVNSIIDENNTLKNQVETLQNTVETLQNMLNNLQSRIISLENK